MSFVTPRITAWSYSRLKAWETCPQQAKFKFLQRLPEPDSVYAARGTEIHKQAETVIKNADVAVPDTLKAVEKYLAPFRVPEHQPSIKTELQQGLTKHWEPTSWFGPQVYLRVVYDLWRKLGSFVSVRDHKTGKIRPEEHADQLDLYATAALGTDPTVEEVDVGIIYVDHGSETKKKYTRMTFHERRQYWDERAGKMLADDIFAPRPGHYCRWCHYRKSNGGPCQFG